MSQRRSRKEGEAVAVEEGELTLDNNNNGEHNNGGDVSGDEQQQQIMTPLSIDDQYRQECLTAKKKHWRESPFAAGLVEISWNDELSRAGTFGGMIASDIDPDSGGCMCCSSMICGLLGAGRVGNMAVFQQTQEWVEEVEVVVDEETNETTTRRYLRPKLVWLVGPYWPMLLCVTYPLIFGVSLATLVSSIPKCPMGVQLIWLALTVGLIYALAMTSFRDPGILYKYNEPPPQMENSWRWSDSAQSYRPRGAFYDPDCAVIVEGFDHT
jgi:hypothetical protein